MKTGVLFTIALLAFQRELPAQMLKCTSADGKVTYQAEPCAASSKASAIAAPASSASSQPLAFGPMKDGWTEDRVSSMTAECVQKTVADLRASWVQQARDGAFPEQDYRQSAEPFCRCIARRTSASTTGTEYDANSHPILGGYVKEALAGGACKPGGRWGRSLEGKR